MLTVTVPPEVQVKLRVALVRAGRSECGGVLMGEHMGENQFTVRELSVQASGSFARFMRDIRSATKALKLFFKREGDHRRFNYLGEWHSHPSFSTQPSATDHDSMVQIATDPKVGANFVVLLIFRLTTAEELEGSAHTYLPDGTIASSTLVLEGHS